MRTIARTRDAKDATGGKRMIQGWQNLVLLFFSMAFLGWVMEVTCKLIELGRFINRGFLIGPYCPIYGFGAVAIVLLLERYVDSPALVFAMAMVICGTLEYLTSYVMEKLFHARWWDYSHRRFNLDGRVCAGTLIPFGLLGLILVYVMKPLLYRAFAHIPQAWLTPLCAVLIALLLADAAVSSTVLGKIRKSAALTGADDTEMLTKAVRDTLEKQGVLLRRTLRAFPYIRLYNSKLLSQLREKKQELVQEAGRKQQRLRDELKQRDEKWRAEVKAIRELRKKNGKG